MDALPPRLLLGFKPLERRSKRSPTKPAPGKALGGLGLGARTQRTLITTTITFPLLTAPGPPSFMVFLI